MEDIDMINMQMIKEGINIRESKTLNKMRKYKEHYDSFWRYKLGES